MIIAAVGTSLTSQAAWLHALERELARCCGHVVVLDFGRSAATCEWGVSTIHAVIDSKPNIVLIEFSINDAVLYKGVSLHRSRRNTVYMVKTIQDARPQTAIFLMTMNPVFGPRRWIRPRLDRYYCLYESLAKELRIGLIDNRSKWQALSRSELRPGIPDGAHPVPELATKILVPNISQAISLAG
jgi:lysophospholipase L1-like esterase